MSKLKLEITEELEELGERLEDPNLVAILNLPSANLCNKRGEFVERNGELEQACLGCVTQKIRLDDQISEEQVKEAIDYFGDHYGTQWITVNGRGDPFHPKLKEYNLDKVRHAASKGIKSYVFNAGGELDEEVCQTLAESRANVMISLFGNDFIDASFFEGKKYGSPLQRLRKLIEMGATEKLLRFAEKGRLQDEQRIAEDFKRLINAYKPYQEELSEGVSRIGMNYVVRERDLEDGGANLVALKEAANKNRIAFFCNVNFDPHKDPEIQRQLMELKKTHSQHTTFANGQCQMGAGSSTTIDFNGDMYRCPYQSGDGDANFFKVSEEERKSIVDSHLADRKWNCIMRETLREETEE